MNDTQTTETRGRALAARYRDELRIQAERLPTAQRKTLLVEIDGHIDDLVTNARSIQEVEAGLAELGEPAHIVDEAANGITQSVNGSSGRGADMWAITFLAIGAFIIPFVGWLVGLGALIGAAVWIGVKAS